MDFLRFGAWGGKMQIIYNIVENKYNFGKFFIRRALYRNNK